MELNMKEIYCEAMNSFALWNRVCLWHDGTNNNYAEETYEELSKELKNGYTAWKKVRLCSRDNGKVRILKEQKNIAIF